MINLFIHTMNAKIFSGLIQNIYIYIRGKCKIIWKIVELPSVQYEITMIETIIHLNNIFTLTLVRKLVLINTLTSRLVISKCVFHSLYNVSNLVSPLLDNRQYQTIGSSRYQFGICTKKFDNLHNALQYVQLYYIQVTNFQGISWSFNENLSPAEFHFIKYEIVNQQQKQMMIVQYCEATKNVNHRISAW